MVEEEPPHNPETAMTTAIGISAKTKVFRITAYGPDAMDSPTVNASVAPKPAPAEIPVV